MKRFRLLTLLLGAGLVLAIIDASASAGRLSVRGPRLKAQFTRLDISGGFGTVECSVTLESSLHGRTISKTPGSLIGYVHVARAGPCSRGGATVLEETLPWHLQYESFGGTLPIIHRETKRITGFAMRVREPTFGTLCLFRSTAAQPVLSTYNVETSVVISAELSGTISSPCGLEATVSGTTTNVTEEEFRPRITITLI